MRLPGSTKLPGQRLTGKGAVPTTGGGGELSGDNPPPPPPWPFKPGAKVKVNGERGVFTVWLAQYILGGTRTEDYGYTWVLRVHDENGKHRAFYASECRGLAL